MPRRQGRARDIANVRIDFERAAARLSGELRKPARVRHLKAVGFPVGQDFHAADLAVRAESDRIIDVEMLADNVVDEKITNEPVAGEGLPHPLGLDFLETRSRKGLSLRGPHAGILIGVSGQGYRNRRRRRAPTNPTIHAQDSDIRCRNVLPASRREHVLAVCTSKEETDPSQNAVGLSAARSQIQCLRVVELQHQFRCRIDGEADIVELHHAQACGEVEIGSREAPRLKVLIGVAIERNRFPIAAEDRTKDWAKRNVISDLCGSAKHAFADIVEGIGVVVRSQIRRIAKDDVGEFAAEFETRVWDMITEIGLEKCEAGAAKQDAGIAIGATWGRAWSEVNRL
jgi:hypothetical protein